MKKSQIMWMARIAIVAALYVVLTLVSYPFSYGMIQFRISEILMLLVFYNKKYSYSMVIGCLLANLFSFNIIDCLFGTLATLLACLAIMLSKKLWLASLFPVIFNGVIVGIELYYYMGEPLLLSMFFVALGEFVVVTLLGCLFFYNIQKNPRFMEIITAEKVNKSS